ncbi:MAG: Gfo/Idh/MocA family oxidoreductase [Deltaproteobacteria bacterium]|nr:Gfo/Idh/MocA family oxidoreductase [Deltaproteobacteria bacterium]
MNRPNETIRVGVVGVGTMGQHHVRIISRLPGVILAGFFDPDLARSREIFERHSCRCFEALEDLLDNVDVLTVAAPTTLHEQIGAECLKRGIHLLMEKPLAHTVEGAARLVELAREARVTLMVGHVERYNPAVAKMIELLRRIPENVVSIDARRLMPFDGSRCMDVDIVHDLLIHDVDLALEIADSQITRVYASGRPVFSKQTDEAHTLIDFENGATAVFWTSKCSPRKVRSITVTTPCRYLMADTLSRTLTVYTADQLPVMDSGVCLMGDVHREEIPVPEEEPLGNEIQDFVRAIRDKTPPLVDGERALRALKALDLVSRSISSGMPAS